MLGAVICAKARVAGGAVVFALIALVLFVSTPAGRALPEAVSGFVSTVDGAATPALTDASRPVRPDSGDDPDRSDEPDLFRRGFALRAARAETGRWTRLRRGGVGPRRSTAGLRTGRRYQSRWRPS